MSQMLIEKMGYHGFNLNSDVLRRAVPRKMNSKEFYASLLICLSAATRFEISPVSKILSTKTFSETEIQGLPIPRLPYSTTWFEFLEVDGKEVEPGMRTGVLAMEKARGDAIQLIWFLFVTSDLLKPTLIHTVDWRIEREDGNFGDLLSKTRQTTHGKGQDWDTLIATNMFPVVYALAMLGCKNVGVVDVEHDRRSIKEMNYRFGGNKNRITYKVLTVRVPRRGNVKLSELADESRMLPLHSVRGHFKEYTPDAPLLGKHIGRYWWHPHVRGTEEYGTVIKDYAVRVASEV